MARLAVSLSSGWYLVSPRRKSMAGCHSVCLAYYADKYLRAFSRLAHGPASAESSSVLRRAVRRCAARGAARGAALRSRKLFSLRTIMHVLHDGSFCMMARCCRSGLDHRARARGDAAPASTTAGGARARCAARGAARGAALRSGVMLLRPRPPRARARVLDERARARGDAAPASTTARARARVLGERARAR